MVSGSTHQSLIHQAWVSSATAVSKEIKGEEGSIIVMTPHFISSELFTPCSQRNGATSVAQKMQMVLQNPNNSSYARKESSSNTSGKMKVPKLGHPKAIPLASSLAQVQMPRSMQWGNLKLPRVREAHQPSPITKNNHFCEQPLLRLQPHRR